MSIVYKIYKEEQLTLNKNIINRELKESEQKGRETGSYQWKLERGELGKNPTIEKPKEIDHKALGKLYLKLLIKQYTQGCGKDCKNENCVSGGMKSLSMNEAAKRAIITIQNNSIIAYFKIDFKNEVCNNLL